MPELFWEFSVGEEEVHCFLKFLIDKVFAYNYIMLSIFFIYLLLFVKVLTWIYNFYTQVKTDLV